MRRLPIFLVIDVSESMMGRNLRSMQEGMDQLIRTLRQDPYALETVHLSVIAFSGRPKTLVPLMDLMSFYPPRLPIGSGTSIGAALNFTMDELDRQLVKTSFEHKGDFKPLLFFMSDGSSTDAVDAALARWQNHYRQKATLIGIAIGPYADFSKINTAFEQVLRLDVGTEHDFMQFIAWISQSVTQHSRSIGLGHTVAPPLSLEKAKHPTLSWIESIQDAVGLDENYVILTGLCAKTYKPYLMKYEKPPEHWDVKAYPLLEAHYVFREVYAAEKDYFEWSDARQNLNTININALVGGCDCPHCGAQYAFATCSCGQIFCVEGDGQAKCPGCENTVYMSESDGTDYNITRSRG